MRQRRFSYSTKTALLITAVLLVVNIAIGVFIAVQSRASIKKLIDERMLGVAKTASAMLDGDKLAAMKESDVGGEYHQEIIGRLTTFYGNFDFKYIYVVRKLPDGKYVFIVDADQKDPAQYGEEVVFTKALASAGAGNPAVDSVAASDKWGKFYTAYCPVMTSDNTVGGIVGIDFDAEWYESQLTKNSVYIIFACAISLIVGGAMVMLVTMHLKRKFDKLNEETESIASDISTLLDEINKESIYSATVSESKPSDDKTAELSGIEKLSAEVKIIKEDLRKYIEYVHVKAYTDGMTGVGNKTAYLDLVHSINDKISDGEIRFSIAVFDVDDLKLVNDEYGHEMGDNLINGTAECVKNVFGAENVFRIGGDEFIAVLKDYSKEDTARAFGLLEAEIKRANDALPKGAKVPVAFSRGAATFEPGRDKAFKEVFRRADKNLYQDKFEHHKIRDNGKNTKSSGFDFL